MMPPNSMMMPPPGGMMPPQSGMMPPNSMAPPGGMMPPPGGMMPPQSGMMPPPMNGVNMMAPPMPGVQQPGRPAQPARRGIDPDSVPSPIVVMEADQEKFKGVPYVTSCGLNPPLATTKTTYKDDGNASPLVMRSTLYNVPCSDDLVKRTQVPLSLIIQPLASPTNGAEPVPVVDHGSEGPVRCRRCRAYLNPRVLFVDGGRRFQCNLCNFTSEVPEHYFCNLDHTGRRHDIEHRPELTHASVEYIATQEYCKNQKAPKAPVWVFVVDVSYNSVQSGLLGSVSQAIRELLDSFPLLFENEPSPAKISIITFDSAVHFYNLSPTLSQPQMMVVPDVNDMFVPLHDGLLASVTQSREVIETLLDRLPHMFANTRDTEPVLGAALQAGLLAARESGGRLLVFNTTLPVAGPGMLKKREDVSLLGTDKEKTLFKPQDKFYHGLGTECCKAGVCADLFLFPNSYIDVATLGDFAAATGGSVYRYPYFKSTYDGEKLIADIRRIITRYTGCDGMMRLRCSTGLRPTDFYGCFTMNNTTDIEFAGITSDTCIAVQVRHDDKLPENGDAHFQAALLYTTTSGQRRIRVHTLSLRCASQLADLYRGSDMDALLTATCKMAVTEGLTTPLAALRQRLGETCVATLACYRNHCTAPGTPAGQLILPECLKLLPLYTSCMLRSPALRPGADTGSDERTAHMYRIRGMGPVEIMHYLYPMLYAVHEFEGEEEIPVPVRPSYLRLKEHGAYILENGQEMVLWVGRLCPPSWIQQVLGAASFQSIEVQMTALPVLSNNLSERVRRIVAALRAERPTFMRLSIAKQKDVSEATFGRLLVEDKHNDQMSYVDFLCHVHREIQAQKG
eukprot:m.27111 g.27111  ORF g.27111 m.27111 type:complete len:849 (-) comp11617_c0_seq1:48-2594(-)